MGLNWVWCGICAKYLAFGTYPTSAVGALKEIYCSTIDKEPLLLPPVQSKWNFNKHVDHLYIQEFREIKITM